MLLLQAQQLLITLTDWDDNTTEVVVNNFIIGTAIYKYRVIYSNVDGEFAESFPKKGKPRESQIKRERARGGGGRVTKVL